MENNSRQENYMENNSRQENSLESIPESIEIKYIDKPQVVDNNSEDLSEHKIIKQIIQIGDLKFNSPLSNKDASYIAENFGHNSIKSLYEDLGKALSMAERNFINHFRNYNGLGFPDMFSKFSKKQKFTVNDFQQILKEVVWALETNSQISNPKLFLGIIVDINDYKISPDNLGNLVY